MAGLRCHRCGATGPSHALGWSTTIEDGVVQALCVRCTRTHVRDIEGKLDEAWWTPETGAD
jgi:hypothetical protein